MVAYSTARFVRVRLLVNTHTHTHTNKCSIYTYLDVWLQISDTSRVSLQISDSSRPGSTACMPCSAGKYSNESSALSCRACPTNATSPAGSSAVNNCTCNAGSSGPDGGTCALCVAGKYKPESARGFLVLKVQA
jgi:hypothetical protein